MSRVGNARRCAGSRMWLRILLGCVALSSTAVAECEYSSVSGSGLYAWSSPDYFYALPAGGSGSLTIYFTTTGCIWSVSSASPVSFTSATSGTASSTTSVTVPFSVASNSSSSPLTGTINITVNDSTPEGAAQCVYENSPNCTVASFSPPSASFPVSGGSSSVTANISPSGSWYWFDYPASWVTTPTGVISGYTVDYTVAANTCPQRTTSITFIEPSTNSFDITESGPTITSLYPSSTTVGGPAFTLTVDGSVFALGRRWIGTVGHVNEEGS